MLSDFLDLDIQYLTRVLNKLKEKSLIEELFQSKLESVNLQFKKAVNNYYLKKIDYQREIDSSSKNAVKNYVTEKTKNPEKSEFLQSDSKDYLIMDSINLENREQKITSILITLRNNPSLTAKIVKSHSRKITQSYMDFLISNFYDPLQPKSCTCKSSLMIFDFIKEVFISETKYIDNVNDLIDNCPLLFKMVISLFNKVQLFDFLAVFLKKLLKKKYLKEILNEQNKNNQKNKIDSEIKNVDSKISKGDLDSKNVFGNEAAFKTCDFTNNTKLRKMKRNMKYKNLIENKYFVCSQEKNDSFLHKRNSMKLFENIEDQSFISNFFKKNLVEKKCQKKSKFHNSSQSNLDESFFEERSQIFESQIFLSDIFIKTENGQEINKNMMKEVMISLINAIRNSLPNEIKFLFYLFKEFCERKNIKKGDIINIFFFQRFLITKCSLDNFHEVKNLIFQYFNEINSNVFDNVNGLIDNFVQYCSYADKIDDQRKQSMFAKNKPFEKKQKKKNKPKNVANPFIKPNLHKPNEGRKTSIIKISNLKKKKSKPRKFHSFVNSKKEKKESNEDKVNFMIQNEQPESSKDKLKIQKRMKSSFASSKNKSKKRINSMIFSNKNEINKKEKKTEFENKSKRISLHVNKPQNYIKPEISYFGSIPEYCQIQNILEENVNSDSSILSSVEEESGQEFMKKKCLNNIKDNNNLKNNKMNNNNYEGIFDIIMKEISDFPKFIKNNIELDIEKLFSDDLEKIKKNSRRRSSMKKNINGNKVSICSYNCENTNLHFDLNQKNEWTEEFSKEEMKNNFCSFHSENFCISFEELFLTLKIYYSYFKNKKYDDIGKLTQLFKSMTKSKNHENNHMMMNKMLKESDIYILFTSNFDNYTFEEMKSMIYQHKELFHSDFFFKNEPEILKIEEKNEEKYFGNESLNNSEIKIKKFKNNLDDIDMNFDTEIDLNPNLTKEKSEINEDERYSLLRVDLKPRRTLRIKMSDLHRLSGVDQNESMNFVNKELSNFNTNNLQNDKTFDSQSNYSQFTDQKNSSQKSKSKNQSQNKIFKTQSSKENKKNKLLLQKKEYEKLAIQNLPKRLIKMQNKPKMYNAANFFLFDLLGHPFMTEKLLNMFKGKSLFKMCLHVHLKCKMNFDSYQSDTKLEKLFNNPNLDKIRIYDDMKDELIYEDLSSEDNMTDLNSNIDANLYENKFKKKVSFSELNTKNLKKRNTSLDDSAKKKKPSKVEKNLYHKKKSTKKSNDINTFESFKRKRETLNKGIFRDDQGFHMIKKIENEEQKLKTRIFFENEKLRSLLLKYDDIKELNLISQKIDNLKDKIKKSRIRNIFKKVLYDSELNICIKFDSNSYVFDVKDCYDCDDPLFVRFCILKKNKFKKKLDMIKLDDKNEENEYFEEILKDNLEESQMIFINQSLSSSKKISYGLNSTDDINSENHSNSNSFSKKGKFNKKMNRDIFGFSYQHVHITKFEELLHFLKINEIIKSYVLGKIPGNITNCIKDLFSNQFNIYKNILGSDLNSFHNQSSHTQKFKELIFSHSNKNNDMLNMKKNMNSLKIPGIVQFRKNDSALNIFSRLNFTKIQQNLSIYETLNTISSIPIFNSSISNFYYSSVDKSQTSLRSLKKILFNSDYNSTETIMKYSKQFNKSIVSNSRCPKNEFNSSSSKIEYLKKIIQTDNKFADSCKSLLSNLSSMIQIKNKNIIDSMFNHSSKLKNFSVNRSEISEMYLEYFYSQMSDVWFKRETFIDDKIFKINCEILNFISIKHLTQIKNSEFLEIHLKSSIDMLRELDITFSLENKFAILHKVLENISLMIHYINETSILPGNEEILVVFIWCVIQAKCDSMKSNLKFLQLFVNDDQKMGELGFAITQLEAAIMFIENISKDSLDIDNFYDRLLKNEVKFGIHFQRIREKETKSVLNVRNKTFEKLFI